MSDDAVMDAVSDILTTASDVSSNDSAQTSDSSQQVDDSTPADDSTEGAGDSPDGEDGEKGGSDGTSDKSKLPTTPQIRQALKAFRDSNPEHAQAAKLLNDGYSRAEAYKEVIPTVEEARNIRAQLDAIGGLEGLASLQGDRAAYEATDEAILSGDPEVLDALIEDAPDGFKKLAPHYLQKLEKLDPQAFTKTIQPHFVKALTDANFPNVVAYLESKLSDKPELQQIVTEMKNWFSGQKQLADKYSGELSAPENDKLKEGWKELQNERRQELETYISTNTGGHIRSTLGGGLKSYSEALNTMPVGMRQSIAAAAITRLAEALDADKAYQTQIQAMLGEKKPDRAKIIDLNKRKVSAMAPKIIESLVKDFGLKPNGAKPGPKPGTKRQAAPAGPKSITQLNAPPKDADIDWKHEHMSEEAYIRGRAVLKNGQYVSWRK